MFKIFFNFVVFRFAHVRAVIGNNYDNCTCVIYPRSLYTHCVGGIREVYQVVRISV